MEAWLPRPQRFDTHIDISPHASVTISSILDGAYTRVEAVIINVTVTYGKENSSINDLR